MLTKIMILFEVCHLNALQIVNFEFLISILNSKIVEFLSHLFFTHSGLPLMHHV